MPGVTAALLVLYWCYFGTVDVLAPRCEDDDDDDDVTAAQLNDVCGHDRQSFSMIQTDGYHTLMF